METVNKVFIATSLDGFIADENGGVDWLQSIPNPDNLDMGYLPFMAEVDALIMGRKTYETILGFGIDWPYQKPVFVLSNSLKEIPKELIGKVEIVCGTLTEVLEQVHERGYTHLYIDGGKTVQSFLKEDLIDILIISIIPKLLGKGIPLFGDNTQVLDFKCISSQIFLDAIVQNTFVRNRS